MRLRVLHLVGSSDSDYLRELSCLYARDCLQATADPERYEPVVAYVTPDGRWRLTRGLDHADIAAAPSLTFPDAVAEIAALSPAVMVPQMFCRSGMTHHRALFGLLGIPYVGNRPETMALAAEKALARAVVGAAGVAVPDGEVIVAGQRPRLAPPVVVKPAAADNSVGVSLVRDRSALPAAIATACRHDGRALVERYVELGREVRCGIIDRRGELCCLPLEEYAVDRDTKPIRDGSDKLARDREGGLSLVAKTPERAWIVDAEDPVCAAVQEAARRCHRALGCRHYSLFDFRVDPTGRPWFLEAGLYCSFARSSVVATMAAAAGIDVRRLFADAIATALEADPPEARWVA
jgi:D-alanine-D-alanine ligase